MNRFYGLPLLMTLCLSVPAGCRTAPVAPPAGQELTSSSIVVYMRRGCRYCEKVENYLAARNIPFTMRNVMEDRAARRDFIERYHGDIVPLIVFGNDRRIIDGCDLPAIRDALKESGLPAD